MAGETTAVSANAARVYKDHPGFGLFAVPFSLTFGTNDNQLNDVMEAGYIGGGVSPYAVVWIPTDMDTNVSPAAVHKVTVGSTDIVTGLTGAQSGTAQIVPVSAIATTTGGAATKVTVTTTTAAATAAAGTATLILLCQKT